ncbi:uncharacterized protein LOC117114109 [Anneissia japonica]|uniref:uncharacterized protein LOC117114109 n=1 Tax=Anneissia japonica TaxID=1529436 RepID=UPI00142597DF|nr:uncharacterized protein LOC117114109 [Anneissia japonica]
MRIKWFCVSRWFRVQGSSNLNSTITRKTSVQYQFFKTLNIMKTYLALCLCLSALACIAFCEFPNDALINLQTQVCTIAGGTQQTTSWFANEESILIEKLMNGIPQSLVQVVHDHVNTRSYFHRFVTNECFVTGQLFNPTAGSIYELQLNNNVGNIQPPAGSVAASVCANGVSGAVAIQLTNPSPVQNRYVFCDGYELRFP